LDAANFLAQLVLSCRKTGKMNIMEQAAKKFRSTYYSPAEIRSNGFLPFEAAALIRAACSELKKGGNTDLAFELLDHAQKRLVKDG
jgi:hypothetical protein